MHVYFLTRGIIQTRNTWVDFMKTRLFPWKRKNLDTEKWEIKLLQGALRPIELWEYVLPAESLMECLAMQEKSNGKDSLILEKGELRPEIAPYAKLIQKLMSLKSIPKFDNPIRMGYKFDNHSLPLNWVPLDGFAVYPIGIKEDKYQNFPEYIEPGAPKGYYQEAI